MIERSSLRAYLLNLTYIEAPTRPFLLCQTTSQGAVSKANDREAVNYPLHVLARFRSIPVRERPVRASIKLCQGGASRWNSPMDRFRRTGACLDCRNFPGAAAVFDSLRWSARAELRHAGPHALGRDASGYELLRSDSRTTARLRPARNSCALMFPQMRPVSRSTTGIFVTPVVAISSATARQVSSEYAKTSGSPTKRVTCRATCDAAARSSPPLR